MTFASAEPTARADATRAPRGPRRSAALFGWFRWYGRRYVAKRFHAVRLARGGFPVGGASPEGPVVVVVNHPSWWDPMIGLVLSDVWPDRWHVAPIDSAALEKYRFFERLGFFGVEPGTARGAREFLRQSLGALADPRAMLWVTAQGRFADVRERPVTLKEGVGHLAARLGRGCVLPLAFEYGFWQESTPEAFARFGGPVPLATDAEKARPSAGEWTARIAAALEATQDALAADVSSRDPSRFDNVISGRSGVGGVYDLWRRLKAGVRGERFAAGHGDDPAAPTAAT